MQTAVFLRTQSPVSEHKKVQYISSFKYITLCLNWICFFSVFTKHPMVRNFHPFYRTLDEHNLEAHKAVRKCYTYLSRTGILGFLQLQQRQ